MGVVLREGYMTSPLGNIPDTWQCEKLAECIDLLTGFPFKSADFSDNSEQMLLLRGINITEGIIRNNKNIDKYWASVTDDLAKYFLKEGDLVISMDGSKVGRNFALVQKENLPCLLVQRVARIRPKSDLDIPFLNQLVASSLFLSYVDSVKTSSGIPHISSKQINDFLIPLPPLSEQIKIARILSTVDRKLTLIDQQITATQTLKKGLMQKLFSEGVGTLSGKGQWQPHTEFKDTELGRVPAGWEVSKAGEHIKILSGFPFKSTSYTDSNDSVRLLRGDNIAQGWLRWRDAKYWSSDELTDLDKYFMEEGDLVIAMDRTWISSGLKVSEVDKTDLPCLLVQRVSRIRAKVTFEQSLLTQLFSSYHFEQYVKGVQTDSVVPHISGNQIQDFLITVPPKAEQKEISKILSTTDTKLTHLTTQKTQTQQLKKGLMQKLLTGQIRVVV